MGSTANSLRQLAASQAVSFQLPTTSALARTLEPVRDNISPTVISAAFVSTTRRCLHPTSSLCSTMERATDLHGSMVDIVSFFNYSKCFLITFHRDVTARIFYCMYSGSSSIQFCFAHSQFCL